MSQFVRRCSGAALLATLLACGGGSGSSAPVVPPEPQPSESLSGLSLANSPDGSTVWGFTASGKLWKSTDGGLAWQAVGSPAFEARLHVLGISPQTVWTTGLMAGKPSLWRSDDGGAQWTQRSLPEGTPAQFWLASDGGDTLLVSWAWSAGGQFTAIYRYHSLDGGRSWQVSTLSPGEVSVRGNRWRFAKDLKDLYSSLFGTLPYGAVQRSQDSGASWQTRLALDESRAGTILTTSDANTLMVASYPHRNQMSAPQAPVAWRFHYTRDGGASWTEFDAPAIATGFAGFSSLTPTGEIWAYLPAGGPSYRSMDFGRSWELVQAPGIAPQYLEQGARWTDSDTGRQISFDQGQSWQALALPWGQRTFSFRQTGPRRLLAERHESPGTALSIDGGASWAVARVP